MVERAVYRLLRFVFCAALVSLIGLPVNSSTESPSEYGIKAAYLLNFAKFVEWPNSSNTPKEFYIGILGDDPFGKNLETVFSGKMVQDKPLVVRHIHTPAEAAQCQIVFISESENDHLDRILNDLEGIPVLTVGESSRFFQQGGMIRFQMAHHNVRFNINLSAAKSANLKISSQLLKVANYVQGAPKGVE